jgi:hypothetical protein
MKNLKKGIWFPISLGILVIVIALWVPFTYGEIFLFNHRLLNDGVIEEAQIVSKGVLMNGELVWKELSQTSEDHQFQVKIISSGGEVNNCQFGVSESLYDIYPLGSAIPVAYLSEDPQKCKRYESITGIQRTLSFGIGISAFMMLIAFGSLFFVSRSYKKTGPGDSSSFATDMELEEGVRCPKCNVEMTEGYLPMGGGIVWRNIDQPVGIPTIFSGLPGTAFFGKRPKLHAYHCGSCKIVTFKYGKK